jgi:hypothetical protein
MRQSYFTFLCSECKRLTAAPVDIPEINQFIDSPEGQKGLKHLSMRRLSQDNERPKSFSEVLKSQK